MQHAYHILIDQIDAFIRKFYLNQILKGVLLFTLFFLLAFLVTSTLAFIWLFPVWVRAILFFGFIVLQSTLFIHYIGIPLSRLWSFGKRISHLQAAQIIGSFFPDVADKLTNTLQLQNALDQQEGSIELITASIQQKASQLSVISFSDAIEFKSQRQYLKYLIPLFIGFISVAIWLPEIFTLGSTRVLKYSQEIKAPAPYLFKFIDFPEQLEEGATPQIQVLVQPAPGFNTIPKQLYIVLDQGKFLMKQKKETYLYFKQPRYKKALLFFLQQMKSTALKNGFI